MCGRGNDVVSAMAAKNTLIARMEGGEESEEEDDDDADGEKNAFLKIMCIGRMETLRFF